VTSQRRATPLGRALLEYRKQARMAQWVLAELLGLEQAVVADLEAARPVPAEVLEQVRGYLKTAPRPRNKTQAQVREENKGKNLYITPKLLLWASKVNMPTEGMEAVRALKEAYEVAKRDLGLASIPMVQLEVENALTLATRGHYRAAQRAQGTPEEARHG